MRHACGLTLRPRGPGRLIQISVTAAAAPRAIDRAWDALGQSVQANRDTARAHDRAEAATRTTDRRYAPRTVRTREETSSGNDPHERLTKPADHITKFVPDPEP